MWEDPRPERIRDIEGRRRSSLGRILLGVVAVLGFAGILLKSQLIPPWAIQDSPTPEVELLDTRSSFRSPAPEDIAAPSPSGTAVAIPAAPSASTGRAGDPQVLQRLAETCRYWTEQNTRGQFDGHQETACIDVARYANRFDMLNGIENLPGQVQSQAPGSASVSTRESIIYVDQCDRHGYGSIEYRRCRASEQQRLSALCQNLRDRLPSAQGSRYQLLDQRIQATCREADRYQIVR